MGRQKAQDDAGRKDKKKSLLPGDVLHIQGAGAELAFHRVTGLPWHAQILTIEEWEAHRKNRPINVGDVGPFEIRSTRTPHGPLKLYSRDREGSPFVLVHMDEFPLVKIVGWYLARDGKIPKFWKDGEFQVPESVLSPIGDLTIEGLVKQFAGKAEPMATTFEEKEQRRKEKLAFLASIFPGDPRIVNALAVGEGVAEQLPPLAEALKKDIHAFYSITGQDPTVAQEEKLMQTVADVLAWATQLELLVHDLRSALFFRFNARIARGSNVPIEPAPLTIPQVVAPAELKTVLTAPPTVPSPETLPMDPRTVADKLQGLFDSI